MTTVILQLMEKYPKVVLVKPPPFWRVMLQHMTCAELLLTQCVVKLLICLIPKGIWGGCAERPAASSRTSSFSHTLSNSTINMLNYISDVWGSSSMTVTRQTMWGFMWYMRIRPKHSPGLTFINVASGEQIITKTNYKLCWTGRFEASVQIRLHYFWSRWEHCVNSSH